MFTPKKPLLTTLAIAVSALAVIGLGYLFASALGITDSYTDDSKIAAVWNVSTSTAGELRLASKTCNATEWFCAASTTCANELGDGDYIIVKQGDAPSSLAWKTANTACDQPQCGINGGQNGDQLKADNTINFSAYPARNYCKSIGGRLPTKNELDCIYDNRASFGSFAAGNYWSGTENSGSYAWYQDFPGGVQGYDDKTTTYYVRCVRGW